MSQQTVTAPGVFTAKAVSDINANFTELYAGGTGESFVSPTITGTVLGGASYTAPTLTAVTITGTSTIGAGMTITSPTLVTPALGTPASGVLTSCTGYPVSALASAGTGVLTALGVNVGSAGAPVLVNGVLGTPSSGTLTGMVITDDKVLAANATYSATTTPATLTGFSWTVVAGTYIFELNLPATMTTVGGLTVNFLLTTAVLTSIQYQSYASTAADATDAVSTNGTTTTSGTKVFDSKTAAYTHVNIKGSMVVGTGGTFAWQGTQNTSAGAGDATVVAIGSYAKMTRVA